MQFDFPYGIDPRGTTATAGEDDHLRDLIEQVLFTAPGERVNRPSFGSGLSQLVFAPTSDALATAVQLTVQGALQQWLGDRITVEAVEVESRDSTLTVTVRFRARNDGTARVARFTREV